jgi:hypothetical protein
MLYIFGTRNFGKRKNAVKNTFCKKCDKQRVKVEWKWFSWFHFFFIPLIPLGYDSTWVCNICGHDKQAERETSIGIKVFVILFFLLVLWLFFGKGAEKIDTLTLWGIRAGVCSAIMYFIYTIVKHKERNRKKIFKSVLPLEQSSTCMNCEGSLSGHDVLHCSNCDVISYNKV